MDHSYIGLYWVSDTVQHCIFNNVCVFMYIDICVWAHVCNYVCVGSSQSQSLPFGHSPLCLLRNALSLDPGLTSAASLAHYQALGVCVCPSHLHWDWKYVSLHSFSFIFKSALGIKLGSSCLTPNFLQQSYLQVDCWFWEKRWSGTKAVSMHEAKFE